jgi:putative transposase
MLVRKAYRFRVYPDLEQESLFRKTIGCCRFVYNLCLDQKKLERERSAPRRLTAFDQGKELKALKAQVEWLKEVPHHALVQAIADLHKAFTNFFEGRADYPTFRRKGQNESFRYPDPLQIKIEADRIFLPKAGWVRLVMHRLIQGKVKNVTVSATAGVWHISIQVEQEVAEPRTNFGPAVGVDLGVEQPIVLSDGTVFEMPRVEESEWRQLAGAQRAVARRQKGSRNRLKAIRKVARLRARQARRRLDAAHKVTATIAKSHGVIVLEDLKVANMTASARGTVENPGRNVRQKAGLNRSLLDVAPGMIRRMLEYKAPWYGSRVIVVDPAYTSQQCSACGAVDVASRISRSQFVCTSCGVIADADVNAAQNILRRGLNPTGGPPGMACRSSHTSGRKQERQPATAGSSALQGRE